MEDLEKITTEDNTRSRNIRREHFKWRKNNKNVTLFIKKITDLISIKTSISTQNQV